MKETMQYKLKKKNNSKRSTKSNSLFKQAQKVLTKKKKVACGKGVTLG